MESRDKKITSLLNQGVINRFKSCGYSDRAIYRASITLATLCVFTSCGDKDKDKDKDEGGEKTKEALKDDLIAKLKNMDIPEGDAKAYAEQVTKGGIELTKDNIERLAQLIKSRAKDGKLDEKALNEIKNELKKKTKSNDSNKNKDQYKTNLEKVEAFANKAAANKTKFAEIKATLEGETEKYKGDIETFAKAIDEKKPDNQLQQLFDTLYNKCKATNDEPPKDGKKIQNINKVVNDLKITNETIKTYVVSTLTSDANITDESTEADIKSAVVALLGECWENDKFTTDSNKIKKLENFIKNDNNLGARIEAVLNEKKFTKDSQESRLGKAIISFFENKAKNEWEQVCKLFEGAKPDKFKECAQKLFNELINKKIFESINKVTFKIGENDVEFVLGGVDYNKKVVKYDNDGKTIELPFSYCLLTVKEDSKITPAKKAIFDCFELTLDVEKTPFKDGGASVELAQGNNDSIKKILNGSVFDKTKTLKANVDTLSDIIGNIKTAIDGANGGLWSAAGVKDLFKVSVDEKITGYLKNIADDSLGSDNASQLPDSAVLMSDVNDLLTTKMGFNKGRFDAASSKLAELENSYEDVKAGVGKKIVDFIEDWFKQARNSGKKYSEVFKGILDANGFSIYNPKPGDNKALKDVYRELIEAGSKLSVNSNVTSVIASVKAFNDKLAELHKNYSVATNATNLDAVYNGANSRIVDGCLLNFTPLTTTDPYKVNGDDWKANHKVVCEFITRIKAVVDSADVSGFANNNCANAFKDYIVKIVNKVDDTVGIKSADRLFRYVCCQKANYDNDANAQGDWINSMVKIMPVLLPATANIQGQNTGVQAFELAVCCPIDTLGGGEISGAVAAVYGVHKAAKTMAFDKDTINTNKGTLFNNAMIPFGLRDVNYGNAIKVEKIQNAGGFKQNDVIVGDHCGSVGDADSIKTFLALLGNPDGNIVKGIFFQTGSNCYVNTASLSGVIDQNDN